MDYSNNSRQSKAGAWFSFPKPNPLAKLRLFCFPYAGSGANIFYNWPRNLPESVEMCLVHLPGREQRLREKPFYSMSALVGALGRSILPFIDRDVAFFGHSMGGLVSFELSRQLRREFGLEPARLFVSGCSAPRNAHLLPRIHRLPTPEFLNELRRLNTATGPMSNDDQILQLMLPTLRADFTVCETYSYLNEPPLDSAISVYGGLQDYKVKHEYLEEWRKETTGTFALHLFRGGHFFIHTAESLVLNALSEELGNLASKAGELEPSLKVQDQCASASP